MNMDVFKTIYEHLHKVVPNIDQLKVGDRLRLSAPQFMDLHVEILRREGGGRTVISLAHYFEQEGDLMADPEMEVAVVPNLKLAEALSITQHALGIYREVYPQPGKVNIDEKKGQNDFLATWLNNLIMQGHRPCEETPPEIAQRLNGARAY